MTNDFADEAYQVPVVQRVDDMPAIFAGAGSTESARICRLGDESLKAEGQGDQAKSDMEQAGENVKDACKKD